MNPSRKRRPAPPPGGGAVRPAEVIELTGSRTDLPAITLRPAGRLEVVEPGRTERLPAVVSTGFQTLSRETIRDWVTNVGRHLDAVYSDTGLTIVSVLNGAVVLASDLLRQFERSAVQLEFVKIRRGDPAPDAGQLDPSLVTGRHVLVVEDVYDSGATLTAIVAHLRSLGPATVKTLTLLRKAGKADRTIPGLVEPDYVGFEIEDQIVAGYGLDANGRLRHLPYLASLQPAAR